MANADSKTSPEKSALTIYHKLLEAAPFIDEVRELIGKVLCKYDNILDVGAGTGAVASYFIREGKRIIGIDPDRRALGLARDLIAKPGDFKDGIGVQFRTVPLRIEDWKTHERFDAAYSASVMPYVDDVAGFSAAVYDMLNPSGIFVVTGYQNAKGWDKLNWDSATAASAEWIAGLSEDEKNVLQVFEELRKSRKIVHLERDSLERTIKGLESAQFAIIESGHFYQDTCYFVKAVKR